MPTKRTPASPAHTHKILKRGNQHTRSPSKSARLSRRCLRQRARGIVRGLFKAELIADRVWRTRSQLELAIVEYVGWFNTARLHSALDDRTPAEFESAPSMATVLETEQDLLEMAKTT